MNSCDV